MRGRTRAEAGGKLASTQTITCVHKCAVAEWRRSGSKIRSARNGSNTQFAASASKPRAPNHHCPQEMADPPTSAPRPLLVCVNIPAVAERECQNLPASAPQPPRACVNMLNSNPWLGYCNFLNDSPNLFISTLDCNINILDIFVFNNVFFSPLHYENGDASIYCCGIPRQQRPSNRYGLDIALTLLLPGFIWPDIELQDERYGNLTWWTLVVIHETNTPVAAPWAPFN